jgi:DnaJ-class molecular chaperone
MRDPYEVLGVQRNASADDIKQAYRKLAKKLHPDLNPGNKKAEQSFKEVSVAYDLLSDPEKKGRFDRGEIDASGAERQRPFYKSYAEADQGARYRHFEGEESPFADDLFADLFRGRAGAGGQQNFRMRGADVSYSLDVDFLEAVNGITRRLNLADGKTLDVTIPAGTEDGQTLRLKGQGQPGIGGGPAGDAFIAIHIRPHPFFTRVGDDIHLELPVSLSEAVLGASVGLPTIDGRVSLKIPPGSNNGKTLRLKGKGALSQSTRQRGDQLVKLKIVLPDHIDPDFKSFVESWSKTHPYDPRSKAGLS